MPGGTPPSEEAYEGRTLVGMHIPGGWVVEGSGTKIEGRRRGAAWPTPATSSQLPHAALQGPPPSPAAGASQLYTALGLLQLVAALAMLIAPYKVRPACGSGEGRAGQAWVEGMRWVCLPRSRKQGLVQCSVVLELEGGTSRSADWFSLKFSLKF